MPMHGARPHDTQHDISSSLAPVHADLAWLCSSCPVDRVDHLTMRIMPSLASNPRRITWLHRSCPAWFLAAQNPLPASLQTAPALPGHANHALAMWIFSWACSSRPSSPHLHAQASNGVHLPSLAHQRFRVRFLQSAFAMWTRRDTWTPLAMSFGPAPPCWSMDQTCLARTGSTLPCLNLANLTWSDLAMHQAHAATSALRHLARRCTNVLPPAHLVCAGRPTLRAPSSWPICPPATRSAPDLADARPPGMPAPKLHGLRLALMTVRCYKDGDNSPPT